MNPRYDFTGQVALVTGGSSGMGLATAQAFAEAGAAVVLADVNEDTLRAATDELTAVGHRPRGRHVRAAGHGVQQRRYPSPTDRRRR